MLLKLGDLDGAARELELAVELKPRALDAHFKLAVVRVNRNELERLLNSLPPPSIENRDEDRK